MVVEGSTARPFGAMTGEVNMATRPWQDRAPAGPAPNYNPKPYSTTEVIMNYLSL